MEWEAAGRPGEKDSVQGSMPPKKKGGKGKLAGIAVVALVLIFVISRIGSCGGSSSSKTAAKDLAWPTSGLATMLPEPPTKKGNVRTNSDSEFNATIEGCSAQAYEKYVGACKDKGFTVDAKTDDGVYEAYSQDGCKLELSYYKNAEKLSITVNAALQSTELTWPTSGPGSLLPVPASLLGRVMSDTSTRYAVKITGIDDAAYGAYVDACLAAGFNVDYNRGDMRFSAKNESGASLQVVNLGFDTISITIDTSEATDSATSESEPETPAAEAPAASASSSSSDVREALDAYEAFMNEYCDFMEKYAADGHPVSMLADYGTMMTKYADAMAKFDAIDESSLSAEDDAYYLEVQGRVLQRLAAVGQ